MAKHPYKAPLKSGEVWYAAEEGFTSLRDHAVTDRDGIPVLAPGEVARVWDAEYRRIKARREKVWNMLLDAMEAKIDLEEANEQTFMVTEQIELLQSVLAVLTLPLGKYEENPEAARETIAREADRRYNEES